MYTGSYSINRKQSHDLVRARHDLRSDGAPCPLRSDEEGVRTATRSVGTGCQRLVGIMIPEWGGGNVEGATPGERPVPARSGVPPVFVRAIGNINIAGASRGTQTEQGAQCLPGKRTGRSRGNPRHAHSPTSQACVGSITSYLRNISELPSRQRLVECVGERQALVFRYDIARRVEKIRSLDHCRLARCPKLGGTSMSATGVSSPVSTGAVTFNSKGSACLLTVPSAIDIRG